MQQRAAVTITYATALSALLLIACAHESQPRAYPFVVHVVSDANAPLAGSVVALHGQKLGTTNDNGVVQLSAQGTEGDRIDLTIECPADFRSPAEPLVITLRKIEDRAVRPEYAVSCPPLKRKLVVAIRAEKGANLPIRYLGRSVAKTDSDGAAHVLIESAPNNDVELSFDTSEQPRLHPRNPSARFRVTEQDEIVVLNQSFKLDAPKRVLAKRAAGPQRIH